MSDIRPIVTDAEIAALTAERKLLPDNWRQRLTPRQSKIRQKEASLEIVGQSGATFEIQARQSEIDPLAFSAIFYVLEHGGVKRFRLRRYNGKSHGHRNRLEGERLGVGFHIHEATERYQAAGFDEDTYARLTNRYSNLWQAIDCLISDCGLIDPDPGFRELWDEEP